MPEPPANDPLRVVIAGAGVAGLETLIALRRLLSDKVTVTLVSPGAQFAYEAEAAAEAFGGPAATAYPLRQVASDFDAELVEDTVGRVSRETQCVFLAGGGELEYDALVVAVGARRFPAWPGVLTYRGTRDVPALKTLADEVGRGEVARIAFVVPSGTQWTLPAYDLALRMAEHAADAGAAAELTLITPEAEPLAVFGDPVSRTLGQFLTDAGIRFEADVQPVVKSGARVHLLGHNRDIAVDRVVGLPVIEGPAVAGLPQDEHGFMPTDPYGFVRHVAHVYAAGDCVTSDVKQGGLAAQQADLIAEGIARRAGLPLPASPPHPVLRGMLQSGNDRLFAREGIGDEAEVAERPLWWPAVPLAGRYLAPYLAERQQGELAAEPTLVDRLTSTIAREAHWSR